MNISEGFIHRPVATTIIMCGILIFGIIAYFNLPVSDLPNVDFPYIQVNASLPGASPETMASSVATPLEKEFTTIGGIDTMTSTSSLGTTQIVIQFNLDRDIDAAAQDVQTAIQRASRLLPDDMPNPPTFRKVNPTDQPIIRMALTSDTLPLSTLDSYGQTIIGQSISMINGVSQVEVYGSQKYAVRIKLDPRELISREIGFDEVADAVAKGNVNLPTGVLYGPNKAYTIKASGQLYTADRYKPLIVAYRNNSPVRLEELAVITDSVENDKVRAFYSTQTKSWRAIILAVSKQPGTNTVEIANRVKEMMPSFQSNLPGGAELHILYDSSIPIHESVEDVKFTLWLTIALVLFVIFIFLRNMWATIIPSLALPISIIGTFAVMHSLNFSLNNLSLMALTLCVGFVVDDAIVMLENIVRHLEMGKRPIQAALDGSKEISFTIISMTISLAAVFIPLLFMGDLVGRLFHEFAVTITASILLSGFVSLTLTPMMCAYILHHETQHQHNKYYLIIEKFFDDVLNFYANTLRIVIHHRIWTLIGSLVLCVITVYYFITIPKGFLPDEDRSSIFAPAMAIEGISFEGIAALQQKVIKILQEVPEISAFMASIGARSGGSLNNANFFIALKAKDERSKSATQIIQDLRPKFAEIPGLRVYPQIPPTIRLGGSSNRTVYQITLQSTSFAELYEHAPILERKMSDLPMLNDVISDLQIKNIELNVQIDRDKASSLGLTASQIEETLYHAYGQRFVSTIYADEDAYRVIMEVDSKFQTDPSLLSFLYIRSAHGKLIPLSSVATLKEGIGPLSVNHLGQLPSVSIGFNLKPGVSIGDAMAAIDKVQKEVIPPNISVSYPGTAAAFKKAMSSMSILLILAILVIYMILGILYESFIHPITILTALPFAGLGALVTLDLFNMDLSLYALVGLIMLIGIVKKNGIMMIDFAVEAQRLHNKSPEESIYEACLVRFRPIMMTTMAALFGMIPLAIGYGAGAEARQPLGLAVMGGLIVSQLLTLYITPVFYIYFDMLSQRIKYRRQQNTSYDTL